MGTFTSKLRLYRPDATEFVDVKTQLNNNWDITDSAVRRLMEYEYTNVSVPDMSSGFNNSRFYKPYSNSAVAWDSNPAGFFQDTNSFVSPWINYYLNTPIWSYLVSGFIEHSDYPIAYRVIKNPGSSTTEIEWTGAFQNVDQSTMDSNAAVAFMDALPPELGLYPASSRYFTTNAGNVSSVGGYSMARIFVGSLGGMEFKRYGGTPSAGASSENRVELTGIRYCVEVTGT